MSRPLQAEAEIRQLIDSLQRDIVVSISHLILYKYAVVDLLPMFSNL